MKVLSNLIVAVVCFFLASFAVAAEQPNIILILSDDIGFSDIGCYGGEIATPNLDALAYGGVRFTQFYNTARCCPSRASLLTGLHPHQAGMGHMNRDQNLPGYRGLLLPSCVTIAEVMRPAGYSTYGVGKWHVARDDSNVPDKMNWPTRRGFDRFYGTTAGYGSFYDPPTLIRDETPISPFDDPLYKKSPDEYYYTDAISDNAVLYIEDHKKERAGKPFFMYVAYTAAHWPIQAPEDAIDKYRGKYDQGYQPIREARHKKLLELGLIGKESPLTPQAEDWDRVEHKAWESRCMEVFAAMVDRMDEGIGRIVDSLKKTGQYENTVILYLQDNGACAETMGRTSRKEFTERKEQAAFEPYPAEKIYYDRRDFLRTRDGYPVLQGPSVMPGPKDTYIAYGRGWANVSNTPFREYKHWVHEGGIATPLIVHSPKWVDDSKRGTLYREPGQLVDIMTTCVELAGTSYPKEYDGHEITPMEGISLLPSFSGKSLNRSKPLFWEHEGNRAVRIGEWKLVAKGPVQNFRTSVPFSDWELYNIEEDRSEQNDLASTYPELVERLSKEWRDWAVRANVLPWPWKLPEAPSAGDLKDGVKLDLSFDQNQGSIFDSSGDKNSLLVNGTIKIEGKSGVFDGRSWIVVSKSPALDCSRTSWSIEAEIDPQTEDGIIFSQGGSLNGYCLFLEKGIPGFAARIGRKLHVVSGKSPVKGGTKISAQMDASRHLRLYVEDALVAESPIPNLFDQVPREEAVVGADLDTQILPESLPPFQGRIAKLTVSRGVPARNSVSGQK